MQARWPRLLRHLHTICSRDDLADVSRRREVGQAPQTTLNKLIDEEWITHGFVGSLPQDTLLWAWDQFALQGWSISSEMAASALWLIRQEVRRLDHAAAGATELRGVMASELRKQGTLPQMQSLLGSAAHAARKATSMSVSKQPQVMVRVPLAWEDQLKQRSAADPPAPPPPDVLKLGQY